VNTVLRVGKEKQQQCSEYQAPPYKIQLPRICAPCTSSRQFRTNNYCIYSNARWGFSLKFGTQYGMSSEICIWSTKLDHAKTDRSEPDQAESNQGLHRQIIIWYFCSCEILCSVDW